MPLLIPSSGPDALSFELELEWCRYMDYNFSAWVNFDLAFLSVLTVAGISAICTRLAGGGCRFHYFAGDELYAEATLEC